MNFAIRTGTTTAAALLAAGPLTARQDVALKDLMPKGMVIGVAINQRQSDGVDTAGVALITKQFNQISPENLLKFQPVHPEADRYSFDAQDRRLFDGLISCCPLWISRVSTRVAGDARYRLDPVCPMIGRRSCALHDSK